MLKLFTNDLAGLSAEMLNWIAMGVIALLALFILYMIFRMIRRPRLASGRRSKQARLAVTDAALIDERRKLVLVRRDNVEHLVLIGGASDLVIESNIRRTAPVQQAASRPAPAPQLAPQAAPERAEVKPVAAPVNIPTPAPIPAVSTPAPAVTPSPVTIPTVAAVGGGLTAGVAGAAALASDGLKKAEESASAIAEKAASIVPEVKADSTVSAVDDMDALLNEITTDK